MASSGSAPETTEGTFNRRLSVPAYPTPSPGNAIGRCCMFSVLDVFIIAVSTYSRGSTPRYHQLTRLVLSAKVLQEEAHSEHGVLARPVFIVAEKI